MEAEEIEAVRNNSFELDCALMTLTKNDGRVTHSGAGYIRQKEDGKFYFRLFAGEQSDFTDVLVPRDTKAGEIIREKHSWTIVAVDSRGRTWTAARIWGITRRGHLDRPIFWGTFHEITRQEGKPSDHWKQVTIEMLTFERLTFPCNEHSTTTKVVGKSQSSHSSLNAATFSSCKIDFILHEDGKLTRCTASSGTATLQPHFDQRVTEALLFTLGVSIPWSVVIRCEKGVTSTTIRAYKEKQSPFQRPPIDCRHIATEGIWELFDLYFKFVFNHDLFEYHPLSAQLQAVYSSRRSSIQIQALTVAVAVESVLAQFFTNLAAPAGPRDADIDAAIKHVDDWQAVGPIKERAAKLIRNLKQRRAIDKLHSLSKRHAVDASKVRVWKKLRDSVAHGDWSRSGDIQKLYDDAANVLVLLYQLIFHLLDYRGKYTDWSARDWPLIDYPPMLSTAPFEAEGKQNGTENGASFPSKLSEPGPDIRNSSAPHSC